MVTIRKHRGQHVYIYLLQGTTDFIYTYVNIIHYNLSYNIVPIYTPILA